MEKLFELAGHPYNTLEEGDCIDISHKNIRIKSFDHTLNKVVFNKINSLYRKQDSTVYEVIDENDKVTFRGTPAHRIFSIDRNDYIHLNECIGLHLYTLNANGVHTFFSVRVTDIVTPVLDVEVDSVSNYFANGLLSHNTSGGNALKFYASQRVDIRKIGIEKMGEDIVGQTTKVKVVKNKIAPPFKEVEFSLKHGRGIDKYVDLIGCSVNKGLIDKAGSWYSYAGERLGQGEPLVVEWLKNNPEIFKKLYEACKE